VSGRKGIALGSLLVGAGLFAGVLIGRSSRPSGAGLDDPSWSSSRFGHELTDTTPGAAAPGEETAPPPVAEEPAMAPPPAPRVAAPPAAAAAAPVAPAPAEAPAPAAAAPAEPPAPEAALAVAPPAPPPPDPYLVRQGRVFNDEEITGSTWDVEDVSEYSVVPDREVTRSSFDDEDRSNYHPTGD
jgi:hypothetical protein